MSPELEIIFELRLQMVLGVALYPAMEKVLEKRRDNYSNQIKIWLRRRSAGQRNEQIFKFCPKIVVSPGRRALIQVLERGLIGGSPIDQSLAELQSEFIMSIESHFEKKLQLLPLKLMIPLTLFILPSVMSLILGPLLITLTQRM